MYSRILYHGTANKEKLLREGFRNKMLLSGRGAMAYGRGFYFTPRLSKARKFGQVVKCLVELDNPYPGDLFFKRFNQLINKGRIDEIADILIGEGFDGILIQGQTKNEVCVFDSDNIIILAY